MSQPRDVGLFAKSEFLLKNDNFIIKKKIKLCIARDSMCIVKSRAIKRPLFAISKI
jgi:hypothetical protein